MERRGGDHGHRQPGMHGPASNRSQHSGPMSQSSLPRGQFQMSKTEFMKTMGLSPEVVDPIIDGNENVSSLIARAPSNSSAAFSRTPSGNLPLPEGIFDSPSKCTSILFPPEPRAGERQTRAPCFRNMWGKAEAEPVLAALRDEVVHGIEREAKNAEDQARDAARHLAAVKDQHQVLATKISELTALKMNLETHLSMGEMMATQPPVKAPSQDAYKFARKIGEVTRQRDTLVRLREKAELKLSAVKKELAKMKMKGKGEQGRMLGGKSRAAKGEAQEEEPAVDERGERDAENEELRRTAELREEIIAVDLRISMLNSAARQAEGSKQRLAHSTEQIASIAANSQFYSRSLDVAEAELFKLRSQVQAMVDKRNVLRSKTGKD